MTESRCPVCGYEGLESRRVNRRYGVDIDVVLLNVEVRECPGCGEEYIVIPKIEQLHKQIALDLAQLRRRLTSGEIRFLRTYLGYSSTDFAKQMGVTPETVSRWESKSQPRPMAPPAERLLRVMARLGRQVDSYNLEQIDEGAEMTEPLRLQSTPAGWVDAVGVA